MKKYFCAATALTALVLVALTLRPTRNATAYDVVSFGGLPVLVNGRVKPIDTVARTSLLMLQGRQRATTPAGATLTPGEWMATMEKQPGSWWPVWESWLAAHGGPMVKPPKMGSAAYLVVCPAPGTYVLQR
jgi:hypothetical protein